MKNSIFKTGWFLMFAAGLLAVMSACKKENTTSELRAVMNDFANSNQKAYIDPEQYSCFVISEEMRVNNSDGTVIALARNDRQCTIDNVPVSDGSSLKAFYPKKLLTTQSQSKDLSNGFSNVAVYFPPTQVCRRDANGNQIIDNPMIAELSGFGSENNTLHFRNLCALLKITVRTRSSFDAIRVTMGSTVQLWGNGTISGGKVVMDGNSGNSTVILSISGHTSSPTGEAFYIMIPEVELHNNDVVTVEFMNNNATFKSYTLTMSGTKKLAYNQIHTLGNFTFNAKVFSVAANKTVIFAPGNLQWSYTNEGTTPTTHSINGINNGYNKGTWRFAPHQYDFIGNGNTNAVGTYIPLSEYIHEYSIDYGGFTDEGYTGWIDLFAWGGSGYGNSRPYFYTCDVNNNHVYYCPNNNLGAYDWGAFNTIYNPKTKVNDPYRTWRVLSKEEWDYLLNINGSNDVNVGRNKNWWRCSNISFPVGSKTIRGLLIYPDEFSSKPSGVQSDLYPMSTATTQCYPITYNEFVLLENLGCAFIPTSGWLAWSGSAKPTPHLEEHWGCYWTSTHGSDQNAYFLKVNGTGGNPLTAEVAIPYLGYSVRLARDVQ